MGRRRYRSPDAFVLYESDKARLNAAFACFRKLGLIAKQNFLCCGGCAGYEIASNLGEKFTKLWNTKGPVVAKRAFDKVKGCVFYTQQDRGNLEDSGRVWLSYGQVNSTEAGDVGIPTVEVGKLIVEVLVALGIRHEWNGDGDERIVIDLRSDEQRKRAEAREREDAEWRAKYAAEQAARAEAEKGPAPGTWAATARVMADMDPDFDWDAWKDQMKEQDD